MTAKDKSLIRDSIVSAWEKHDRCKYSSNGWISSNSVCCHHRGHRKDSRGRGGLMVSPDGSVVYHCFNCNFKAGYYPGKPLGFNMRKFLIWLGYDESVIRYFVLQAMREYESAYESDPTKIDINSITFKTIDLPKSSKSFVYWANNMSRIDPKKHNDFYSAITYASDRCVDLSKYDLYWTPDTEASMHKRIIIPYTNRGDNVGYAARTVSKSNAKYIVKKNSGYVFNLDKQQRNRKFVIVTEGTFDALCLDAVATMSSDITELQAEYIENLYREVIVVPHWDKSGKFMLNKALEYGWNVSFPVWREDCKDINDAVMKYGKLFVLKTIIDSTEHSSLKIQLMEKNTKWMTKQ